MTGKFKRNFALWALILMVPEIFAGAGRTFYVSSSEGDDANDGLSQAQPFATIQKVNDLALLPGDAVLFKCGDLWRGEMLIITESGTQADPIVFSSYPGGCGNKPIISGAQPISGWSLDAGNVYVADLSAGANSGKFVLGINQLFRNGQRLAIGRWPNLDEFDHGYAAIDEQPSQNRIRADVLPAGNWNGAAVHIKGMRWYILNREVTATIGTTLTLNENAGCWDNSCLDWGFFINHHRATLDREGEWFYDGATHRVYLYSAGGPPSAIEGSVIMAEDNQFRGGIVLGRHLQEHIGHVTIENFEVSKWDMNGITTPTNLETHDNFSLILRDNHILDVDATGINLQTWVWNAAVGPNGWRGGHDLLVENNLIRGANHFGINAYTYDSIYENNHLMDIGLIENLGRSGLGCGMDGNGGLCTENGDGIRLKVDQPAFSGFGNSLICNRLEGVGYNGIDILGATTTVTQNFIERACISKGDCGAIRTFGTNNLANTQVYDLNISGNIILDTMGNTDGAHPTYKALFGVGLYFDHFSANVTASGNTIAGSTIDGILYQNSSGQVTDNLLFGNNSGSLNRGQLGLYTGVTQLSDVTGNVFYSQAEGARTLTLDLLSNVTNSDFNYFFNPFSQNHIVAQGLRDLAGWQTLSGQDQNSVQNWFSLVPGATPLGTLFYNDTKTVQVVALGGSVYLDLDQNPVMGSFELQPFEARVLILESLCNPTAAISGDSLICPGETATLEVTLTGEAPWDLLWSDGFQQNGVVSSPVSRMVSPAMTTTYAIETVEDNRCQGTPLGGATVVVADPAENLIQPGSNAQGLDFLSFTAAWPCHLSIDGWDWYDAQDQLLATQVNPLVLDFKPTVSTSLEFRLRLSGGGTQSAFAAILVPLSPAVNQDLNGDGCNTAADLFVLADQWPESSQNDPDGDGIVTVLDFPYVNVDGETCP